MKTAVSIPDDIFEEAERIAARLQTSRSRLYARALAEFLNRHAEDQVTSAMNAAIDQAGAAPDEFTRRAAGQTLGRSEW